MAQQVIGKVSIIPCGEFQSNTFYSRLSLVSYQGSSYIAVADNENTPVTDTSVWYLVAAKGEQGEQGAQGEQGPQGEKGDTYQVTEADLEAIAAQITSDASSTFNQNVTEKTNAFNDNYTEKLDTFNENFETKNEFLEGNLNIANEVVTGSDQVVDALYWNIEKLNSVGADDVSQDTTTGKNLLEVATLSLEKPDNRTKTIYFEKSIPSGIYTFSWEVVSSTLSSIDQFAIEFRNSNNQRVTISSTILNNNGKVTQTFNDTCTRAYFYIYSSEADGASLELKNMQLEAGSTATPYEQYTGGQPSPNTDYPQEIKVLTGNVSVEESNKNLVDWGNMIPTTNTTVNFQNDTLSVTSTSGTYKRAEYDITELYKLNAGKNLRFRNNGVQKTNSDATYGAQIQIDRKSSQSTYINLQNNDLEYFTHSMLNDTSNVEKVTFKIYQNNSGTAHAGTVTIFKPILVVGEDTTYVPHQGESFLLTIPSSIYLGKLGTAENIIFKNASGNPNYNSTLTENAWYWKKGWKKVVLDGSETWGSSTDGFYTEDDSITKLQDYRGGILCDHFQVAKNNTTTGDKHITCYYNSQSYLDRNWIYIKDSSFADASELTTWLSSNNTTLCVPIKTLEYVLVEDTTLIEQLELLLQFITYRFQTNITITGGDIDGKLDFDYYVDDRVAIQADIADLKAYVLSQGANI